MRSASPLISICILSYNHEKFIGKAIESVINQITAFDVEIVIGDDLSEDNTRAQISSFQAELPHKIYTNFQKKNQGVWQNLYSTILLCRGEYIALLDGDDYWDDLLKLEKQAALIDGIEEAVLVHTNFRILEEHGLQPGTKVLDDNKMSQGSIYSTLLGQNLIANSTVLVKRKKLLEAFSYLNTDQKLFCVQDYPLWLYLASRYKILYLPESTMVYRMLTESVSHSNNLSQKIKWLNGIYLIRQYFQENVQAVSSANWKKIRKDLLFKKLRLITRHSSNLKILIRNIILLIKDPKLPG